MALGGNTGFHSVTDLSRSLCYHYQYSSICDSINGLSRCLEEEIEQGKYLESRHYLGQALLSLKSDYFADKFDDAFYLLNTDGTPIIRLHPRAGTPDQGARYPAFTQVV